MKKKKRFGLVLAAAGLVLIWLAGFFLGLDAGRISSDSSRIRSSLGSRRENRDYRIPLVAKSSTGKKEVEALNGYLEAFAEFAEELEDCQEGLKELAARDRTDAEVRQEAAELGKRSDAAYREMKELVQFPEHFLESWTEGDEEAAIWLEDWCEDLKAAHCSRELQEVWKDVYRQNRELAGQIK